MRFWCLTVFILRFQTSNFKDCTGNLAGSDILQKHSINSLLEHNEMILPAEGELNWNFIQRKAAGSFLIKFAIRRGSLNSKLE